MNTDLSAVNAWVASGRVGRSASTRLGGRPFSGSSSECSCVRIPSSFVGIEWDAPCCGAFSRIGTIRRNQADRTQFRLDRRGASIAWTGSKSRAGRTRPSHAGRGPARSTLPTPLPFAGLAPRSAEWSGPSTRPPDSPLRSHGFARGRRPRSRW